MPFHIGKPSETITVPGEGSIDYSADISQIKEKNTQQDARLLSAESELASKATLVDGKVPFSQLPDIPAGRKVPVANSIARLSLAVYPDLTIAYEADTGETYILAANANPSVPANWTRLGNAQALGVSTFKGRTGNVLAESGDYTSEQITETTQKYFLTSAKEASYEKTSNRGVANGYAPLGSAAKVPMNYINGNTPNGVAVLNAEARLAVAQLPTFLPQTKRIWRDVKSIRNVGDWITNTSGNEMVVHVRASLSTTANRFISLIVRENASASTTFTFNSTVIQPMNAGNGYADSNTIVVPAGWQYTLAATGGSTNALTERWYELS